MNIAIIDDDPMLSQLMRLTLNQYSEKHNCELNMDVYNSGEAFLKDFSMHKYDIVFMDIYMDGMSGVDTAKQMRTMDTDAILIFLTSSGEHMPDAFSCHAFDYVIKPTKSARVFQVMDDCLEILSKKTGLNNKYIEFIENYQTIRVFLRDLVSLSVDNHYVDICTSDGKEYHVKQSFSALTQELTDDNFLLINRGILVNLDYVSEIADGECFMTNKSSFSVKVREKSSIQQKWLDYTFRKKSNA